MISLKQRRVKISLAAFADYAEQFWAIPPDQMMRFIMKAFRIMVLSAAALFVGVAMESTASADGFATPSAGLGAYYAGGFPAYGFGGYFSSPYAMDRIPTPPYFAIHPPVYYSAPFPRTYGYSPFAYPGTVRTPEIEVTKPVMIENPYTSDKKKEDRNDLKTAKSTSRLIINPFVRSSDTKIASVEK